MQVTKRLEIRTIIKFGANIGKTPTDTYKLTNLKGQAGQIQCHEGWFLNGTNAL
jgi:hypothetical protein